MGGLRHAFSGCSPLCKSLASIDEVLELVISSPSFTDSTNTCVHRTSAISSRSLRISWVLITLQRHPRHDLSSRPLIEKGDRPKRDQGMERRSFLDPGRNTVPVPPRSGGRANPHSLPPSHVNSNERSGVGYERRRA